MAQLEMSLGRRQLEAEKESRGGRVLLGRKGHRPRPLGVMGGEAHIVFQLAMEEERTFFLAPQQGDPVAGQAFSDRAKVQPCPRGGGDGRAVQGGGHAVKAQIEAHIAVRYRPVQGRHAVIAGRHLHRNGGQVAEVLACDGQFPRQDKAPAVPAHSGVLGDTCFGIGNAMCAERHVHSSCLAAGGLREGVFRKGRVGSACLTLRNDLMFLHSHAQYILPMNIWLRGVELFSFSFALTLCNEV